MVSSNELERAHARIAAKRHARVRAAIKRGRVVVRPGRVARRRAQVDSVARLRFDVMQFAFANNLTREETEILQRRVFFSDRPRTPAFGSTAIPLPVSGDES